MTSTARLRPYYVDGRRAVDELCLDLPSAPWPSPSSSHPSPSSSSSPSRPTFSLSSTPLADAATAQRAQLMRHELERAEWLALPGGLAHAHVHLDKAFLLDRPCCAAEDGSFQEALVKTNVAKAQFTREDLLERGRRLIRQSLGHGVLAMRAFVEVDLTVGTLCYEVGAALRHEFRDVVDVRLVCFAQEQIHSYRDASQVEGMLALLERVCAGEVEVEAHVGGTHADADAARLGATPAEAQVRAGSPEAKRPALRRTAVTALGSAPYVELDAELARRNIETVVAMAEKYGLDVDFHLDYDVDESKEPLVWHALDAFRARWPWSVTRASGPGSSRQDTVGVGSGDVGQDAIRQPPPPPSSSPPTRRGRPARLSLGHMTKLSLFDRDSFDRLADACRGLPVCFVALPNSDMYMMARQRPYASRNRGTLPIFELTQRRLACAVDVNNVANLFTPQGNGDPLSLLPLLVGVHQRGALAQDAMTLLRCVTTAAAFAGGVDDVTLEHATAAALVDGDGPAAITTTAADDDERRRDGGSVGKAVTAAQGRRDSDPSPSLMTLVRDCRDARDAVLVAPPARVAVRERRVVAGKVCLSFGGLDAR